jgi:hypothetical protein
VQRPADQPHNNNGILRACCVLHAPLQVIKHTIDLAQKSEEAATPAVIQKHAANRHAPCLSLAYPSLRIGGQLSFANVKNRMRDGVSMLDALLAANVRFAEQLRQLLQGFDLLEGDQITLHGIMQLAGMWATSDAQPRLFARPVELQERLVKEFGQAALPAV